MNHQDQTATTSTTPAEPVPASPVERDTLELLRKFSRKAVEPTPERELLADLGYDSLQVLELVGELEDHFGINVPLNSLTHIRTVGQMVVEVERLVSESTSTTP